MSRTSLITGTLAPCELAGANGAQGAPEWVQLLPLGKVEARDGRRWTLANPERLIAAFRAGKVDLAIDYEHQADKPAGAGPVPAAGWIRELAVRDDGLWGRVEWTGRARELIENREYRYLSPAFAAAKKGGEIVRLLGAGLVHRPALHLKALAQEEFDMNWTEFLTKLLGMSEDASDDEIRAALERRLGAAETAEELGGQIRVIAEELGLAAEADPTEVIEAVRARISEAGDGGTASGEVAPEVAALQTELAEVTTQLATLREERARTRAEAFIDGEIQAGRVGVKPLRDHYIARHMDDAGAVEKEICALPKLSAGSIQVTPPTAKDGKVALTAAEQEAARVLGIDPEEYAKTLASERKNEEAL